MTKSCFLCSKKLGFMDDTFGKYTLSQGEYSIPKGIGDEDVICYDCLQSQQKLEQPKREESKPRSKESKPELKPTAPSQALPSSESNMIWILPILLGWIGGVIMFFVLKDEDKERGLKGLYVGIVISVISAIVGLIIFFLVGI